MVLAISMIFTALSGKSFCMPRLPHRCCITGNMSKNALCSWCIRYGQLFWELECGSMSAIWHSRSGCGIWDSVAFFGGMESTSTS